MSGFLLDANVLIALSWPAHVSHARAHRWFERHAEVGWATCPLTHCAFVRILSNPAFSPNALTPRAALELLGVNLKHSAHRFWPDDVDLSRALRDTRKQLTGHRQITDAYLLALAAHHRGKLATLDMGIKEIAKEASMEIELIG